MGERPHVKDMAAIVAAGAILLLSSLAAIDLFNPDEPREAEIAREMRTSGDLLIPTFNGCPFLEKPPLFYWSVLLLEKIPGLPAEVPVRLPSVLAGIGLLLVTYLIGADLYDRRTGRAAAFVLLTTFQFWWLARRALLDMTLAFFIGAVLFLFVRGLREKTSRARTGAGWFLLAGLAAAGAVMTKGLIGLVIPAVTIVAYLLWSRKARLLIAPAVLVAALLPVLALALWVGLLAARPDGAGYVREFLIENHVKRFAGGGAGGHAQPVWYYIQSLATDLQPWVLFLPGALIALWPGLGWRHRGQVPGPPGEKDAPPGPSLPPIPPMSSTRHTPPTSPSIPPVAADAFLYAWLVPSLIVLSASSSKRSLYLLPLAPAIALFVAAWWRGWGRPRRGSGLSQEPSIGGRRLRGVTMRAGSNPSSAVGRDSIAGLAYAVPATFLLALGVVLALAMPIAAGALVSGGRIGRARDLFYILSSAPAACAAGAGLLIAVASIALLARRKRRRAAALAIALLWLVFGIAGARLLPLAEPRISARRFGDAMARARARGARLAASRLTEGSLGQFLFYSGGTLDWIGRPSGTAGKTCCDCRLTTTAREFLEAPGRRACLVLADEYETLRVTNPSCRVIESGKVGGASYVLMGTNDGETTSAGNAGP